MLLGREARGIGEVIPDVYRHPRVYLSHRNRPYVSSSYRFRFLSTLSLT